MEVAASAEAASLRFAAGPLAVEVARIAWQQAAGTAELSGVKVSGPLGLLQQFAGAGGSWTLAPLAAADGTLRTKIVDAHLGFDADVTVPIRHGQVDFDDVTVEHVGPDSRMGVSAMGLYVDAPNGRSYLYQFPSKPLVGVEFEQRGALLGPWVSDRGKLQLQPFVEGLLGQAIGGPGLGFTAQARALLARTSVSGEVQLGDGKFAGAGVQAELAGHADGRNSVRIHSDAVGSGLGVDIPSLLARGALLELPVGTVQCDEVSGSVALRFFVEGGIRFLLELPTLRVTGLRLTPRPVRAQWAVEKP